VIVDFVVADYPLVISAHKLIEAALTRAGSAVRAIGHSDDGIVSDSHHLGAFEARFNRARIKANGEGEEGAKGFVGQVDVPQVEAAVIRTGVMMLLARHTGTADRLQAEIDLNDRQLGERLGDMRNLVMRLGGQADLFTNAAQEKQAMAAEMGLSGAAVGAAPKKRWERTHKPKSPKEPKSTAAGRKSGKRAR